MKRITALLLSLLLCLTLLAGCDLGSYQENLGNGNNSGSGGNTPDTPQPDTPDISDDTQQHYTVTLYYKNARFDPQGEDIKAVWQQKDAQIIVPVGSNGIADAGVLDGDYDVYLLGLPTQYAYDPNGHRASGDTDDNRHVTINIVDVTKPVQGDGGINATPASMGIYINAGCYIVHYEGTYRAQCVAGRFLYYEYTPMAPGRYSIKSCVNIYDDEINPIMEVWGGTTGAKFYLSTIDGGGASKEGGYTKNFVWEVSVSATGVGQTFTFGISAESKMGNYPAPVDFIIKYEGSYVDGYEVTKVVNAQEARGIPKAAESTKPFVYADMNTKLFNVNNFRYDPNEGVWRVYDEVKYASTGGFGPYLCVQLMNVLPCFTVSSIYASNNLEGNNFLMVFDWDDEYQQVIRFNYEYFIREDYKAKCNSDGVCYVTQEMQKFLQMYAENHNLWTDGVSPTPGCPESYGYDASQDSLWLFACGFYQD